MTSLNVALDVGRQACAQHACAKATVTCADCAQESDSYSSSQRRELYQLIPHVKREPGKTQASLFDSIAIFESQNRFVQELTKIHPEQARHVMKNREVMRQALSRLSKIDVNASCTVMVDSPGEMEKDVICECAALPQVKTVILTDARLKSLQGFVASLPSGTKIEKFELVQQDWTGGCFERVRDVFTNKKHNAQTHLCAITKILKEVARDDFSFKSNFMGQATVRISSLIMSQLPVYLQSYLDEQFKTHHKLPLSECITLFEKSRLSADPRQQRLYQQLLLLQLSDAKISNESFIKFVQAWYRASEKIQSRYLKNLADRTSDCVAFSDTFGCSHCRRVVKVSQEDSQKEEISASGGKEETGPISQLAYREYRVDLERHFKKEKEDMWMWRSEMPKARQILGQTKTEVTLSIPFDIFIVESYILQPNRVTQICGPALPTRDDEKAGSATSAAASVSAAGGK